MALHPRLDSVSDRSTLLTKLNWFVSMNMHLSALKPAPSPRATSAARRGPGAAKSTAADGEVSERGRTRLREAGAGRDVDASRLCGNKNHCFFCG